MTQTVEHFGVHEMPSGIRFLMQDRGAEHALSIKLDLEVELEGRKRPSPHRINLHERLDRELPEDLLVKMFLPIPTEDRGIYYLADTQENLRLVTALRRLSSPTSYAKRVLLSEAPVDLRTLTQSNIQPTLAVGFHPGVFRSLLSLQSKAPLLLNRVIVLLPEWLAKVQPTYLQPQLCADDLASLPMERIGASVLRRYLNHEYEAA